MSADLRPILFVRMEDVSPNAVREAECRFLFLPQYSPDLNLIEMAISMLKVHLRRIGSQTFTDMFHAFTEICVL